MKILITLGLFACISTATVAIFDNWNEIIETNTQKTTNAELIKNHKLKIKKHQL